MMSRFFLRPSGRVGDGRRTHVAIGPWELHVLRTMRPHLMLIGPAAVTRKVIHDLGRAFLSPTMTWRSAGRLILPTEADARTLILEGIQNLSMEEQQQLCEWLPRVIGSIQVVSTSNAPLLPLVEEGRFLDTLYYRINLLYVPCHAVRASPGE
jgi:transcriptional regulator of acetoin/glycerol metabolism